MGPRSASCRVLLDQTQLQHTELSFDCLNPPKQSTRRARRRASECAAVLMTSETSLVSTRPVQSDERETHGHEDETQGCETRGLEAKTADVELEVGSTCSDVNKTHFTSDLCYNSFFQRLSE